MSFRHTYMRRVAIRVTIRVWIYKTNEVVFENKAVIWTRVTRARDRGVQ